MTGLDIFNALLNPVFKKRLLLGGGMIILILDYGSSFRKVYGQENSAKPESGKIAKVNKSAETSKPKLPAGGEATAVINRQVLTRIEVKSGDNPPLLTLATGQVTTIKLQEVPVQILVDRVGLSIAESNSQSIVHNVYLVPLKTGIHRNLIIETASGKMEFELQSIGAEAGKPAVFTREVEVKSQNELNQQKSLEKENSILKESLAAKEREIAATTDRIAQAAQTAQKSELKIQTEMLFSMAKGKKNRVSQSAQKEWEISECFSSKTTDGSRIMGVYEIVFRGPGAGRFLEVKSDAGAPVFWQTEGTNTSKTTDGFVINRGGKIKIAVIEFTNRSSTRGLVFVTDGETVKL